jgi:hypothetical protein
LKVKIQDLFCSSSWNRRHEDEDKDGGMIVMKPATALAVRAAAAPAVTFFAQKAMMMPGTSPVSAVFPSIEPSALALRGGTEVMDLTRV